MNPKSSSIANEGFSVLNYDAACAQGSQRVTEHTELRSHLRCVHTLSSLTRGRVSSLAVRR